MCKFRKITAGIFGVFVVFQLSSCTKLFDHVFGDDQSPKKCRIVSFTQNNVDLHGGPRTAKFYYNRHGNIDSIIADVETGSAGAHLFYFIYDHNHRLIGYREGLGQSYPYEEVHIYAYENGRIVRDSSNSYTGSSTTAILFNLGFQFISRPAMIKLLKIPITYCPPTQPVIIWKLKATLRQSFPLLMDTIIH